MRRGHRAHLRRRRRTERLELQLNQIHIQKSVQAE